MSSEPEQLGDASQSVEAIGNPTSSKHALDDALDNDPDALAATTKKLKANAAYTKAPAKSAPARKASVATVKRHPSVRATKKKLDDVFNHIKKEDKGEPIGPAVGVGDTVKIQFIAKVDGGEVYDSNTVGEYVSD